MTTSKASSSVSSLNATSTSSKRLSGLISGLDTDTIVQQMTSGTQSKIDKQMQNKQLALWRQQSYRQVTSALTEFKNKYFSASSSSSNILSPSFFSCTSIKNTSPFLNVSGNVAAAKNMAITKISQLARQASLTSKHKVSNEAITSGTIKDSWVKNALSGSSITINYGGKDYSVALNSDFDFNEGDGAEKIVKALNDKITQIDGLNGKINFSIAGDKVTLKATDGEFSIKDGSAGLLGSLGLKKDDASTNKELIGTVDPNSFFKSTIASGSKLDFTIDGKAYSLQIPSEVSISSDISLASKSLEVAFTEALRINTELKDKLDVTVASDGKVSFSKKDGTTDGLSITGGTENMLQGLGLVKTGDTYSTSGTMNSSNLVKTYLQDSLAGSTVTFGLNGVSRNITFKESEKSDYSTPDKLKTYLQGKLDYAYGTGKVKVEQQNGKISFSATDSTSTLSIDSCDKSGVLGINGALHTYAGESNRINTNKTLEDIQGNLSGTLTPSADGTYGLKINDKVFTFKSTDTIANIISKINNDTDANVTIAYSTINDSFSVTAKDGGSTGRVDIAEVGTGTLANALFGQNSATTKATLSYDFTGKDKATLADKTITVDGTTYQFLNGGTATGTNIGIDISGTTNAADIATAFSTTAALSGYEDVAADGKVTFTATTAGSSVIPSMSGDVIGTFYNGDYSVQGGQDAKLTVSFDGNPANTIEIVRGDNKFTLDGVNFELNSTTDDATVNDKNPIRFTGDNKSDELYTKVKGFIDDYNALIELANGKVSERKEKDATYLPLTDAQRKDMTDEQIKAWETKAKKGILQGDSILNSLGLDLRHSMADIVNSTQSSLFQIGIASKAFDYTANGKLTIDETVLKKAINDDPEKISSMFTGTDGIATRLQNIIDKNIKTVGGDGILIQKAGIENGFSADKNSITNSVNDFDKKIKELQTKLKTQQEQYYSKFTRLEQYLSRMNSQANLFLPTTTS